MSSSGGTSNWAWQVATTTTTTNTTTADGCVVLGIGTGGFVPWDNPDNIVSEAVEQAVDTAVGGVCLPLLFLLSAPTNVLNMLVFWRQGLRERINLCLFYLSLVDLLHMLHAFFCNVDRLYMGLTQAGRFGPVFQFLADHRLLGLRSLTWLSGFLSMFIACERCLCVVSPLKSQTVLSTRTTCYVLAFTTLFCLTGFAFQSMRWSLVCVFDPRTNITLKALRTSRFYTRYQSHLNVLTFSFATVQPLIYVTVIVTTTIVTSVKLRKMAAWRERTSSSSLSSREMLLTRMLIAASVLYIVCAVPTTVIGVSVNFLPHVSLDGRNYNLIALLFSFYKLASYINATFNFFIYCSLGTKYRSTLRELFTCRSRWCESHRKMQS
ncbi:uncharacterized protein LOC143298286 [Babylonia areolata]|uniref:uncharacterized protein LOC143298286 n=1 Tax=Babylonia areolata TaxID=304850 RepID=UPI003FD181E7